MPFILKYFGWLLGPVIFLWLAAVGLGEFMVSRAVDSPYDEQLSDQVRALAAEVQRPAAVGARVTIPSGAVRLLRSDTRDRIFYALRSDDGQLLSGDPEVPPPPQPARADGPTIYNGLIDENPVRVAALQFPDPTRAGRMLTIQVAETLNKRQKLAGSLRAELVAPQGIVLVGALLLVAIGLLYVMGPMERLQENIDKRDSADLSPLDAEAAPRELRPLIASINGLMTRLAGNLAAQRRFIADAAHQLRTPLAGIKSQTELALAEPDPAVVRKVLERLAAGTEHATGLANRLLTLARAETALAVIPDEVDLTGIAHDVIVDHLDGAAARGQDLGYAGPEHGGPVVVRGDALLLRELLSNLVDNAVRYTPEGGTITVTLARDALGRARLAVADSGPGVPPDERERVFEPFYRGDTTMPGTGLGLAIVRTIAAAHSATIALGTGLEGRGLAVALTFPLPQAHTETRPTRKDDVSLPA